MMLTVHCIVTLFNLFLIPTSLPYPTPTGTPSSRYQRALWPQEVCCSFSYCKEQGSFCSCHSLSIPKAHKLLVLQSVAQTELSPRNLPRDTPHPSEVISALPSRNAYDEPELFQGSPGNKHSIIPINSLILLRLHVTIGEIWLPYPWAFASAIRARAINLSCTMTHQQSLWTLLRIMFLNA